MFSSLLLGNGLPGSAASAHGDVLDLAGFGVASLDEQTELERAYAPLPAPSGQLLHDPDFALPTTAGALPWRLFHYSTNPDTEGSFGYGRRASWPLRLCAQQEPPEGSIITVMLEREDGLGATYVSENGGTDYAPLSPRLFDTLTGNPLTGFTETRLDTGTTFHYPAGGFVSLSYFETINGKRVTFDYDTDQYLASVEEPAGRRINLAYNAGDKVEAVTDWAGRIHTFGYVSGNLRTILDPGGYVTTFAYDGKHRLSGVLAPNGFVTTFTYDDNNRVTSRSIDGKIGYYEHSDGNAFGGVTVLYTDPFGKRWTTYLDGQGNVVKVIDPIGATRQATYNAKGLPTLLLDGQGRETVLDYDTLTGHETFRQEPTLGEHLRTYDIYGNLLTDTDPLGRVHTYTYTPDPEQRLILSAIDPLGQITTYTHTAWGAVRSMQSPLGHITTYAWDDTFALLKSETDPLGHVRTYEYDLAGNRVVEMDEAGNRTTYAYDGLGRQTFRTDALGHVEESKYDGVGNLTVRVDALGYCTSYTYNASGDETEEWDARGFRHTTVYDLKGREIARVDPNGHTTESLYDFADNRVGQLDALGRLTQTEYDLARRPTTLIDTTGLAYMTEYDGFDGLAPGAGRTVAQVSPSGHRTTSVYDAAGQLIASVDTAGHRTTFVYDKLGRLSATVEPTGARTTTLYDADGRTTGVINALGYRSTSTYDARGQLLVSQDAEGKRYTTSYDARGQRKAEWAPDGTFMLREYDALGRATGTLDHLNLSTATQYDALGQVRTFTDEYNRETADAYDAVGQAVASRDYLGKWSQTTYDPARRPVEYQNPQGNVAQIAYDETNAVTAYFADPEETEFYHYDDFGRFEAVEDAQGERTSTVYDTVGRVGAEMDSDGISTSLIYDLFGRWAALEDPDGYRVTTNFDPFGREVGYTDELGYSTTLILDLLDRPIGEIAPDGSITTFGYDAVGRVTNRMDALGVASTTMYDGRGNVSAQMDALGYRTTHHYDPFSRPVAIENALGYRTSTSYDSQGRVNATTNARGYTTTTLFDALSRPYVMENALGQRMTTHYDVFGRGEAQEDALGHRTSTVYDARSRVIGQIDALGYRTTTHYDTQGRANATEDALGRRTTTLFDRVGRVTGQVSPLGYITTTLYDTRGNAVAQMDARGNRTSYSYDARGQQIAVKDALGWVTTSVYDGMGRQVAAIDALGYVTTTSYDARGQVTSRQDAFGYLTTSLYDVLGRTEAQVDTLGRRSTSVYDPLGRTVAQVNALSERMTMAYDEVGNRLAVVNALGYATSYSYDILDRQSGWMDPLGRRHTLGYDAVGRLSLETDAKGQATTHTYNGRGEETYRLFADGQSVSMVFDRAGQSVQVWDSAGVFTYGYDADGRLQSVLGPDYPGRVPVTYSYDGSGNRVGMASWWGVFTYGYDARGQMTTLADPGAYYQNVDGGTTTFAYDAREQQVRQDNANGTTATSVYDALGRVLQTRQSDASGAEVARSFYAYEAVGRPLFKDTRLARHTYSYDGLDRLSGEEISGLIRSSKKDEGKGGLVVTWGYQRATWTYDEAGRRDSQQVSSRGLGKGAAASYLVTFAYDVADELLTTLTGNGVTTYSYDANGSRTQVLPPSGYVTSYTWDGANRLQAVELLGGARYTETYRADGLRHSQTRPVGAGSPLSNGVEVSLWDEASAGSDLSPLSWKGRVGTSATLLGTDSTTQGTWKNVYGGDGFLMASGGATVPGADSLPRYAQVSLSGFGDHLWDDTTSDVRALQTPTSMTDRIAAAWLGAPVVDLHLVDERPHVVSLYLVDFDNWSRNGEVVVTDADTNAVLYSQSLSNYGNGIWLKLRVSGHVKITLNNFSASVPDAGAVLSGLFFDPAPEAIDGTTELLAQVFTQGSHGQNTELVSASGSTRKNIAVSRDYHEDAQGTVEAVTVGSGGAGGLGTGSVQTQSATDAWGNGLSRVLGSEVRIAYAEDNPFLYLGGLGYWQEADLGDLGLTYVRARWLDTNTAQWLSADPVDGEPRYSYAHQKPTMRVDPSGTKPPIQKDDQRYTWVDDAFGMFTHFGEAWNEEYFVPIYEKGVQQGFVRPVLQRIEDFAKSGEPYWRNFVYKATKSLPPKQKSYCLYLSGLTYGLLESAYGFLTSGATLVFGIWDVAMDLISNPGLLKQMMQLAGAAFSSAFAKIKNQIGNYQNLNSYQKGLFVGQMVGLVVQLIFILKQLAKLGISAAKLITSGGAEVRNLSNSIWNGFTAYRWAGWLKDPVSAARFGKEVAKLSRQAGRLGLGPAGRIILSNPVHRASLIKLYDLVTATGEGVGQGASAGRTGAVAATANAGTATALTVQQVNALNKAKTALHLLEAAAQTALPAIDAATKNFKKIFENVYPDDPIYGPKPRQTFTPQQVSSLNFSRRLNYVVSTNGQLILGRIAQDSGHIDLISGRPVYAAGEVLIVKGEIRYIDNTSGHYLPEGPYAERAAIEAFEAVGLSARGKYIEKFFDTNLRRWMPVK